MTTSDNNKRIAKNTLLLYFRMLFSMVVSLYTSRVILATLGIEDYGINNVVGGVVVMFSFLNASMATSTQRYMTFELGQGNREKLSKVFSTSLTIHIAIGLLIILLSETIGLWFLNQKLVIPSERMYAANWVYQFSVISCFLTIIQVPYSAALIAHEKMDVFAYIGMFEVIAKLLLVYLLTIIPFDKLISCSALFFLVSFTIRMIYQIYCRRNFEECHFRMNKDRNLFKSMFGFAGWNLFGSIAWLLRDQGVNIILNLFMGPAVNAARGVALQVSSAVSGFVSNFTTAINPQITKNYAVGQFHDMEILAYRASKFSFFVLFFISFPLILNIDFVLDLWLEEVPNYASVFVTLILIDSMVNAIFGSPFITSLMATGKIRNYQIIVSSILLCIVPVGYFALHHGFDAPSVFVTMIVCTLIAGISRYTFCVYQIGFSPILFLKRVAVPIFLVVIVTLPATIGSMHYLLNHNGIINFIVSGMTSVTISTIAILAFGLTKGERNMIFGIIRKKTSALYGKHL